MRNVDDYQIGGEGADSCGRLFYEWSGGQSIRFPVGDVHLRFGEELLQGSFDERIEWGHCEDFDGLSFPEFFEGKPKWRAGWRVVAGGDGFVCDHPRKGRRDAAVASKIRVDFITHTQSPVFWSALLHLRQDLLDITERDRKLGRYGADGFGVFFDLGNGTVLGGGDGVRGAEDDGRPYGPALFENRDEIFPEEIGRSPNDVVESEHDGDKRGTMDENIPLDPGESVYGGMAAHSGIDHFEFCRRVVLCQEVPEKRRIGTLAAGVIVESCDAVPKGNYFDRFVARLQGSAEVVER